MKKTNSLIVIVLCCFCGCYYEPWVAEQLLVEDRLLHRSCFLIGTIPSESEYMVNNVMFNLIVKPKSASLYSSQGPFSVTLLAFSNPNHPAKVLVESIKIHSTDKKAAYSLCDVTSLPVRLSEYVTKVINERQEYVKLGDNEEYTDYEKFGENCFYEYEFSNKLSPSFKKKEKITITFNVNVNGEKGKVTFHLKTAKNKGSFQTLM
jgi:hypothetical protein